LQGLSSGLEATVRRRMTRVIPSLAHFVAAA
jgi:hypothetical protein